MDGVKACFEKFDGDEDGTLSLEEIGQLMIRLDPEFSEEYVQLMLEKLGTKGDSSISFDVFCKWLSGEEIDDGSVKDMGAALGAEADAKSALEAAQDAYDSAAEAEEEAEKAFEAAKQKREELKIELDELQANAEAASGPVADAAKAVTEELKQTLEARASTVINGVKIPKDIVKKWISAGIKEMFLGEAGKIGELFDSGLSDDQIGALEPFEVKVKEAGDRTAEMTKIISSWAQLDTIFNGVSIGSDLLGSWISAAIKEMILGEAGKIGEFFDSELSSDQIERMETFEVAVNGADDKPDALAEAVIGWGLPGGKSSVDCNATAIPTSVFRSWMRAVKKEWIDGEVGKIGELFDKLEAGGMGDFIPALEPYEMQVKDADDKDAKLAEIVADLGL